MLRTRRPGRGDSGENGQTLVMVALVMIALFGLAAMALDVGEILWSRGAEQNAADAAALAGVRALPGDPDTAVSVAKDYAMTNGFNDANPRVEVIAVPTVVTLPSGTELPALDVTVLRSVPPGSRAAVGGGDIVVPARAIAVITTVLNRCRVLPMAIENKVQPYDQNGNPVGGPVPYWDTYGYKVELKMSPGSAYSSGNFGSLALAGGTGGNDYRDFIAAGGGCVESDNLPTETGAMTGPTAQGFDLLIRSAVGQPADWPALCATPGIECTGGIPDNVHWNTRLEPRASGDPADKLKPWGLGSPNPAVDSRCSGPPTADEPYPTVVSNLCPRVVTVPIVEAGSWDNGSSTVHIVDWASFYVLGTTGSGTNMRVVGSFLSFTEAPTGSATWGDPTDASQIGFFLWK